MPHCSKTHEENRTRLCLICFNKGKTMRLLNDEAYNLIEKFVLKGFDRGDHRLPSAICGTCRLVIQDCSNGNLQRLKTLKIYDYSIFVGTKPHITRLSQSSTECDCILCETARSSFPKLGGTFGAMKQSRGRPPSLMNDSSSSQPPTTISVCSRCLSVVGRGKQHHCTITARTEIKQIV